MRVLLCGASVALLVFFDSLPRLILRIWKLCFHGINRVLSLFSSFILYCLFFGAMAKTQIYHSLSMLSYGWLSHLHTQFQPSFSPLVDVSFIISTRPPSHHRRSLSDVRRERFWCLADHQQHPSLFCSFLSLGCTTAKADIHKLTTHTQEQQQKKSHRHDGWDILREWERRMKSKNIAKISCQADVRKDDSTGNKLEKSLRYLGDCSLKTSIEIEWMSHHSFSKADTFFHQRFFFWIFSCVTEDELMDRHNLSLVIVTWLPPLLCFCNDAVVSVQHWLIGSEWISG